MKRLEHYLAQYELRTDSVNIERANERAELTNEPFNLSLKLVVRVVADDELVRELVLNQRWEIRGQRLRIGQVELNDVEVLKVPVLVQQGLHDVVLRDSVGLVAESRQHFSRQDIALVVTDHVQEPLFGSVPIRLCGDNDWRATEAHDFLLESVVETCDRG